MTARTNVDAIIVAHNAGDLLSAAVRSAADQVGEDHVWVMDAESTDDAPAAIVSAFPRAHVVPVPNAGFSASNNRGIEATDGGYVLLLNPDAELQPGAVGKMISAAWSDPKIAIVGPLVTLSDGSVQPGSWGRFPTLPRRLGLGISRLMGRGSEKLERPSETTDVDWVTGACMLVRRSAIEDAGLMDEGFFLYYEDVEWCHRMHDRGWRVVVEPAAGCVHHLGKSDVPSGVVARAYRDSFYRYCDLYGLWGLKLAAKAGLAVRQTFGGRE